MASTPEISVIIPVYKVERYLEFCVASVLAQTFQDFEIILVDDGSPDNCPAMCDEFSRKDSRIRVVHKENAGLGMARNSGLDVAVGKYVCFLDSDDYLALNTLEYTHALAEKESADQVRYMFRRFIKESAPKNLNVDGSYTIGEGREGIAPILNVISPLLEAAEFTAPTNASACTSLYRRSVLEDNNIRFFSERNVMSEDFLFSLDVAVASRKIVYTPENFYNYRHNPASLSTSMRFDRIERAAKFSEFYAGRLKSYGYTDPDVYAMGYTIGEMRSFNTLLAYSKLPYSERKQAFLGVLNHPYIKRIQKEYPIDKLPLIQRVAFSLNINRQFLLTCLVSRLRASLKN